MFSDHRSHYSYLSDKGKFWHGTISNISNKSLLFLLKIVPLSLSTRYDLGGDVNFFTIFPFTLHGELLCILTGSFGCSSGKGLFQTTGYLCWLITLLFSIFEVSYSDGIIFRILLLKERVVGDVFFNGAGVDKMKSNAKYGSSSFSNTYRFCRSYNHIDFVSILFFKLAHLIRGELEWRLCVWNSISY